MSKTEQEITLSKQPQIAHTHGFSTAEPDWSTVKKAELPAIAYAIVGNVDDDKTWKYPHHYLQNGTEPDEHGHLTKGELLVSIAGLEAATKAAEVDKDEAALRHLGDHQKTIDPDRDGRPLKDTTGLDAYFESRDVPRYAFSAPAKMTLGDNGGNAKSAPITLIALSGEILDRPEWGPCIQDLAGMTHKNRIAVDWRHNADELVGYINNFDTSSGQLVLSGALVPQKTHQRTEEIIENEKQGIPLEASIYFPPWRPDDLVLEHIEEGATSQVNGRTVTAPAGGLTIFRKWELRGVAICPHGADGNTAAYLQAQTAQNVKVTINKTKGDTMSKQAEAEAKAVEAKAKQEAEEKAKQAEDHKEPDGDEPDGEEGEGEGADKEPVDPRKEFSKMVKKFGAEFAAKCFAEGMSYEEAERAFGVHEHMKGKLAEEAEQKGKQSAPSKPTIRFQQCDASNNFGLSDRDVANFEAYAQENNISDEQIQKLMKNHSKFKQQVSKNGTYSPDPKAEPVNSGSATLSKIGQDNK